MKRSAMAADEADPGHYHDDPDGPAHLRLGSGSP
jgi:hypothetical protein